MESYLDYSHYENFVIAGTAYADTSGILLFKQESLSLLEEGKSPSLKLEKDYNNKYDIYAVRVYWKDYFLGYIPKGGTTCLNCNAKVYRKHGKCPICGSYDLTPNGLNYRLSRTCDWENYFCYLRSIEEHFSSPFHCSVYWKSLM